MRRLLNKYGPIVYSSGVVLFPLNESYSEVKISSFFLRCIVNSYRYTCNKLNCMYCTYDYLGIKGVEDVTLCIRFLINCSYHLYITVKHMLIAYYVLTE